MIISCTPLLSIFNDYDFSDFTNLTPYTLPIMTLKILPLKCSSYFLVHRHYPRQQLIIRRYCIISMRGTPFAAQSVAENAIIL